MMTADTLVPLTLMALLLSPLASYAIANGMMRRQFARADAQRRRESANYPGHFDPVMLIKD